MIKQFYFKLFSLAYIIYLHFILKGKAAVFDL